MQRYVLIASIALLSTLGAHATAAATIDSCAAMHQRAAALATPTSDYGTEGEIVVTATKASYWDGPLSYAFVRTTTKPPSCGQQVVTLIRKGFAFGRSNSDAFSALGAVFGTAVAGDFARSRYLAATKVADQARDTPMGWYRGKIYGYGSLTGSNAVTIYSLEDFDAALARAQKAARAID